MAKKRDKEAWARQAQAYAKYLEEHGKYPPNGNKLSFWAANTRRAFREGSLEQEIIALIKSYIPDFFDRKRKKYSPEEISEMLRSVQRYIEEYHRFPPISTKEGKFASQQRALRQAGKLSEKRVQYIESITPGFFGPKYGKAVRFFEKLKEAKEFYEHNGRLPNINDGNKYGWVAVQRKKYRNGTLPADRIEAIQKELPEMLFGVYRDEYEKFVANLKKEKTFLEKNGKLRNQGNSRFIRELRQKMSKEELSKREIAAIKKYLPEVLE